MYCGHTPLTKKWEPRRLSVTQNASSFSRSELIFLYAKLICVIRFNSTLTDSVQRRILCSIRRDMGSAHQIINAKPLCR